MMFLVTKHMKNMFKNIFFKKSKMNYRRWLNVLEKSPLEKLPTVVECFAKINECFREIIPTDRRRLALQVGAYRLPMISVILFDIFVFNYCPM